ncbi:MAG: CoB--CoM heterodisulfide reductase iron-sulfur subunit B family protein [Acidimicrobiales bacterium]|jgi:heterodisulfide reductase subunit B
MNYTYYPGCSARGTGRPYEESLQAVFEALGSGLDALDDWNCCGATAYPAVDMAKAFALSARNLALAEDARPGTEPVDLVAPCAGCYRALLRTERALSDGGGVADRVGGALRAAALHYEGRARTRHPLDVLVNDIGLDRIADAVVRPLEGLRVACYYGCLLVRPYATFDDQREPTSLERLVQAVGAEPVDWPLRTRCCGGSCYCGGPLVGVMPEATLELSRLLLEDAAQRGANVIVTVCPLCQFNLEAFQGQMSHKSGKPVRLTVSYFSQVVGLALGLDERALGIHRMLNWRLASTTGTKTTGANARA